MVAFLLLVASGCAECPVNPSYTDPLGGWTVRLSDASEFGLSRELVVSAIATNKRHRAFVLANPRPEYDSHELDRYIYELWAVWDSLMIALDPSVPADRRLFELSYMRRAMRDDYDARKMPAHIPHYRR